tara:strand:+ start:251 stop:754 length:504 start_codon:yes stop_codon:yes gene_type:complete
MFTRFEQTLAIVMITVFVSGYICVKAMNRYKQMYTSQIKDLQNDNTLLMQEIDNLLDNPTTVTVTMYRANKIECDQDPDITADGTKIHVPQSSRYRYVALSRNLLKRWGGNYDYGDYILIKGTKKRDGIYQVRDTMNSKFTNVVDILESHNVKPYKFTNVKLYKLNA